MKLQIIKQTLLEMGQAAQVCPKCGHSPIHKTHNYNAKDPNNKWKCKLTPLPGYPLGSQTGGTTPTPAAATPVAPRAPKPAAAPTAVAKPPVAAPVTTQAGGMSVTAYPAGTAPATKIPSGTLDQNITKFFEEFQVTQFVKNSDGSFDINQDFDLTKCMFKKVPIKLRIVKGDMKISSWVTSLQNCPSEVTEDFDCTHAEHLKSLEGGPQVVGGSYSVSHNRQLASLEGVARQIGGDFECTDNKMVTSLKGIHKMIDNVGGEMNFSGSGVKECVLGLMLIDGVTKVILPEAKVTEIINKHLKSDDRDMNDCQEELIDAGFTEWAKL